MVDEREVCHKPTLQSWWEYITHMQIGRYEKKGAQPSADILSKLANSLGVSSDDLTNGTSDDLAGNSLTDKELLNQFKAIEYQLEKCNPPTGRNNSIHRHYTRKFLGY